MLRRAVPARLLALLIALAPGARADDAAPSALAGRWHMNAGLSGDLQTRIADAAGAATMSGGPSWAQETWFPWGTSFGEHERIEVRAFLMATIAVLQDAEIEVSPQEIKTIHAEEGVRIFNLTRKSAGSSAMTGERVLRQAHWQGGQLTLESKGKDSLLSEILTPVPARQQLTWALRLEAKTLKKPLGLELVYDRVPTK
jgi:hypothetical protein